MDAYSSVTAKVQAICREMAGSRAPALRGDQPAREANDLLGQALASEYRVSEAD